MDLRKLLQSDILGLTIIGEARGEPIQGQVAVGCAIRNRLHLTPSKYHSYHDVCLEEKQFSCWNEDDKNYPMLIDLANKIVMGTKIRDIYLVQCMFIAQGIIDWSIVDNTYGARFYLTHDKFHNKQPEWLKSVKTTKPKTIGNQVFFDILT